MIKCICFVRVSTAQQDFEAQKEAVIRAAIADGYKKSEIKVVEGKESAIKLSEEQRKTLIEMERVIEDNPTVESVYVFAIDRLARRVSVVLSVKDKLLERGINLVFLNPRKMSTMMLKDGKLVKDDVTEMLLMFLAYGAQMEMQIKQARWKEVKAKMAAEGKVIGGKPQLGYYKKVDKTIGINDEEADIIRHLFHDYITQNIGLKTLYREYELRGLLPHTKGEAARLQAIFRDETYSGKRHGYPQIVDDETQRKAIEKMKAARSMARNNTKNYYLSKGILYDEETHYAFNGMGGKGYYRLEVDGQKIRTVNINAVDSIAWDVAIKLKALQLSHQQLSMAEENAEELEVERLKLNNVLETIERLTAQQERAFSMWVKNKVSESAYTKVNDELTEQLKALEADRVSIERKITTLQDLKDNKEDLRLTAQEANVNNVTDDGIRRQFILETIKCISVTVIDSLTKKLTIEPKHKYRTGTALPHHYITRIGKAYKTEIFEAWEHPDGSFAEIPFTGKFLKRYIMDKNKTYHCINNVK